MQVNWKTAYDNAADGRTPWSKQKAPERRCLRCQRSSGAT